MSRRAATARLLGGPSLSVHFRRLSNLRSWPTACLLALAIGGCSDDKPKHITMDASHIALADIKTPTVIAQARLDTNAAITGIDAVAGGEAPMSVADIERRLKTLGFGVEVKKGNYPLFFGHAGGVQHGIIDPEGRKTISAAKAYSQGGRNILETLRVEMIFNHVEVIDEQWAVVIGELPKDIPGLPAVLQPNFAMVADDHGLDSAFVGLRLARFGIDLPRTSDRRPQDAPTSGKGLCFTRAGDPVPGEDCKDVSVGYQASYYTQSKTDVTQQGRCHGEICTLSLYIKDSKLFRDIQKQLEPTGRAAFVKAYGEPDPEKK